MNIPVYGFKQQKVWTAAELLGDDQTENVVGNPLRDAMKLASEQKKAKGGSNGA